MMGIGIDSFASTMIGIEGISPISGVDAMSELLDRIEGS